MTLFEFDPRTMSGPRINHDHASPSHFKTRQQRLIESTFPGLEGDPLIRAKLDSPQIGKLTLKLHDPDDHESVVLLLGGPEDVEVEIERVVPAKRSISAKYYRPITTNGEAAASESPAGTPEEYQG